MVRRGLKLGDAIRDAMYIYGLRSYFGASFPSDTTFWATVPHYGAPNLAINVDKDGRVNHMALTPWIEPY